jgi:hypothetical protein
MVAQDNREALNNAVEWLRHHKPLSSGLDDPTVAALADAAGMQLAPALSPESRQKTR